MEISLAHRTDKGSACVKLNEAVQILMRRQYPEIEIIDLGRIWNANVMHFSFLLERGRMQAMIEGSVVITDKEIILKVEIPELINQNTVHRVITQHLNQRFGLGSP